MIQENANIKRNAEYFAILTNIQNSKFNMMSAAELGPSVGLDTPAFITPSSTRCLIIYLIPKNF